MILKWYTMAPTDGNAPVTRQSRHLFGPVEKVQAALRAPFVQIPFPILSHGRRLRCGVFHASTLQPFLCVDRAAQGSVAGRRGGSM